MSQVKYLIDMSQSVWRDCRDIPPCMRRALSSASAAVDEYVPLSRASDGTITTQFTMTTLEELGLLKMDFLGLRTLTVIQNAVSPGGEERPENRLI